MLEIYTFYIGFKIDNFIMFVTYRYRMAAECLSTAVSYFFYLQRNEAFHFKHKM